MANTPKPCDECIHLYYDCTQKDNPNYNAGCKLLKNVGNKHCPEFKHWEDKKPMLKRFGELNIGDFFKFCRRVYIKTYEFKDAHDKGIRNCIIISRSLAGNQARLGDEDTVEHLPNMKH